jgi:serine/threonine protein kinase
VVGPTPTGAGGRRDLTVVGSPRPASLPSHLRLVEVVGTGGAGTVWRARDRRAGRDVAVKVVDLGGPDGAGRFESEVRALARLRGLPGIVAVEAVGVGDDAQAWIVSELWSGGSLADRPRPVPPDVVVEVGVVVAAALAGAHGVGVVHGDVTPANVLLDGRGGAGLCDFGLAVLAGPQEGSVPAFTPAYSAPERLEGSPPSAAGDVFGLGATLRAVAGPVRGLDEVVARCCAPDPGERPAAAAVADLLASERRRRSRATRGGVDGG